ncbi:MAG: GTPase [Thermoguttaceae bacterium]
MTAFYPPDDTIAAIASPPGGGARGILRISGPGARDCVMRTFRRSDETVPETGILAVRLPEALVGWITLDGAASRLPCELYYWPTHRSFTGEPVAEIHTLGSPPLLEAALRQVCSTGARMAEPGEFTLRAFLAGRLDLTQAEAVLGVIDAADPRELQVALTQLAGGLAGPLHELRDQLLDLLAQLEAGFDFADEDLPFISAEELQQQVTAAAGTIARLADQMASRRDATALVRVVLRGWPNTGKSSLFNALAERDGAIVSDIPGTTRDYLTAELALDGVKCLLVDTAGVELLAADPSGGLQEAAQTVTERQTRQAQVQILCLDSTRPLNPWEAAQVTRDGQAPLLVLTKTDAPRRTDLVPHAVETSSVTGQGLDLVRRRLRDRVLAAQASGGEVVAGTAARCRESLRLAGQCLERAGELAHLGGEELVAAEVRVALEELGKVVGTVYTEDVLDRIFSRFCIGK